MIALKIEPLPEGGILVSEVPPANGLDAIRFLPLLFACSDLGEALDFIKGKLAPVEKEASKPVAAREQVANATVSCHCPICQVPETMTEMAP